MEASTSRQKWNDFVRIVFKGFSYQAYKKGVWMTRNQYRISRGEVPVKDV